MIVFAIWASVFSNISTSRSCDHWCDFPAMGSKVLWPTEPLGASQSAESHSECAFAKQWRAIPCGEQSRAWFQDNWNHFVSRSVSLRAILTPFLAMLCCNKMAGYPDMSRAGTVARAFPSCSQKVLSCVRPMCHRCGKRLEKTVQHCSLSVTHCDDLYLPLFSPPLKFLR